MSSSNNNDDNNNDEERKRILDELDSESNNKIEDMYKQYRNRTTQQLKDAFDWEVRQAKQYLNQSDLFNYYMHRNIAEHLRGLLKNR